MADRIRKYTRYSRLHGYVLIAGVCAIIAGFVAFLFLAEGDYVASEGQGGVSVEGASSLLGAVEDTVSGTVGE